LGAIWDFWLFSFSSVILPQRFRHFGKLAAFALDSIEFDHAPRGLP
jgi:hypothetical protein